MKVNATIRVIKNRETGTSMANGRAWCVQRIVIGWEDSETADGKTHEQLLMVKICEADLDRFDSMGLKVGDRIECYLSFFTSSKYERVYNDIVLRL